MYEKVLFEPTLNSEPSKRLRVLVSYCCLCVLLLASSLISCNSGDSAEPAVPAPTAPNLHEPSHRSIHTNSVFADIVLSNSGGDVSDNGCSVVAPAGASASTPTNTVGASHALPPGLKLTVVSDNGRRTCALSGIAMAATNGKVHLRLRATNPAGLSEVTIPLTVTSAVAPSPVATPCP